MAFQERIERTPRWLRRLAYTLLMASSFGVTVASAEEEPAPVAKKKCPPGYQPCPQAQQQMPGVPPSPLSQYPAPTPFSQQPMVSDFQATGGSLIASNDVPNMIGDFFGTLAGFRIGAGASVGSTLADSTAIPSIIGPSTAEYFQLPDGRKFGTLDGSPILVSNATGGTLTGLDVGQTQYTVVELDPISNQPIPGAVPTTALVQDVDTGTGNATSVYLRNNFGELAPTGPGFAIGRMKLAESNNPIPQDRILFNYSYFDNVPLFTGGLPINRFSPGFEKTFLGGNASVEMRFPFATTVDNDILIDGTTNTDELLFGNISLVTKFLLHQTNTRALSVGLNFSLPTADDMLVQTTSGNQLIRIDNESVHLMPWIGGVLTPNDRFFMMGMLQFDFDTNGNSVYLNQTGLPGGELTRAGTLNEAAFAYLDLAAGYWMYRGDGEWGITGFAPMVELHWNRSLQKPEAIRSGLYEVGSPIGNIEVLNAVVGCNVVFRDNLRMLIGYSTPLGSGSDSQFDGELRLNIDWRFGPRNRSRAAQPLF